MDHRALIHLLNRASFGASLKNYFQYLEMTREEVVNSLFEESGSFQPYQLFGIKDFKYLMYFDGDIKNFKAQRQKNRNAKIKLNNTWFNDMANGTAQLREKMTLFWHDHFACSVDNPIKTQKQLNTLKQNALEYFGDLLLAISKDPAMNEYLSGQLNIKSKPNENFAREVLELFSLGEGNYSEKDIQEAARAFTGYGYDGKGNFYIYTDEHDNGVKNFLGKRGNFNGDDIIEIILENQKTSDYLVSKIYKYFTGLKISKARLNKLSDIFYQSGYHIEKLLSAIFTSDWFYEEKLIGTKIKSPIELYAGILRLVGLKMDRIGYNYLTQKKLDQVLFNPPNVSGWTSDKNWIHLSTLTERICLANELFKNKAKKKTRNDNITNEGIEVNIKRAVRPNVKVALKRIEQRLKTEFPGDEIIELTKVIFSCNTDHIKAKIDKLQYQLNKNKISFIDSIIYLLSLPEYQLH